MAIIDMDFFKKNKLYFISAAAIIIITIGIISFIKYENYIKGGDASLMLGKGIRLYLAYHGKNTKTLSDSIGVLKKIEAKYPGAKEQTIANFYMASDYLYLKRFNASAHYLLRYVKIYPVPHADNLSYLAYSELAVDEINLRDYNSAIKYLAKMAKINNVKLQEYALLEEASVYTRLNKYKRAIGIYKSILENDALTKNRSYIENLIQLNSIKEHGK